MRIVKPIFGPVATIESRIALPNQALCHLRPTATRDIGGLHQRWPALRVGVRWRKNFSPMSERAYVIRSVLERARFDQTIFVFPQTNPEVLRWFDPFNARGDCHGCESKTDPGRVSYRDALSDRRRREEGH
jgi:hypothetical protein